MTKDRVLVDTDVISFILKRHPLADLYLPRIGNSECVLSFQTTAELVRWALARKWGKELRARLDEFIRACLVIPWSGPLSEKWAEVCEEGRKRGMECEAGDAWIGATAILYGIPLVSHNRIHYEWMKELGLDLICEAPPV